VSDQNCTPGDEFNGGNVLTEGVELSASISQTVWNDLVATGSVSYTYTDAMFETSFFSNYIAWGIVQQGDQFALHSRTHRCREFEFDLTTLVG